MDAEALRVLVVDDFAPSVRKSTDYLITRRLRGEAAGRHSAIESMPSRSQVIVMNVKMPGLSGVEATRRAEKHN